MRWKQFLTPVANIDKEGWNVPVLERRIHSFLFARLLKSKDKNGVLQLATEGQAAFRFQIHVLPADRGRA